MRRYLRSAWAIAAILLLAEALSTRFRQVEYRVLPGLRGTI